MRATVFMLALLALPAVARAQTETIEYYAIDGIGSINAETASPIISSRGRPNSTSAAALISSIVPSSEIVRLESKAQSSSVRTSAASAMRAFYPPRTLTSGSTVVAPRAAIAEAAQTIGAVQTVTTMRVAGSATDTP